MCMALVILTLADQLSFGFYLSISLLGLYLFLATTSTTVIPRWRRRLWWIGLVGVAGVVYFVIRNSRDILSPLV